jgi:hypothetical protein
MMQMMVAAENCKQFAHRHDQTNERTNLIVNVILPRGQPLAPVIVWRMTRDRQHVEW